MGVGGGVIPVPCKIPDRENMSIVGLGQRRDVFHQQACTYLNLISYQKTGKQGVAFSVSSTAPNDEIIRRSSHCEA